jgi:hypothetical protein
MKTATAYGWKPPGWVDPEWRARALEKGWNPPSTVVLSSIGVACDPLSVRNLRDGATQTAPTRTPRTSSSSGSFLHAPSKRDEDEDEVFALIDLFNEQKKKSQRPASPRLEIKPPDCVFSHGARFHLQPPIEVFRRDAATPRRPPSEVSSDEDLQMDAKFQQLLNQSLSGQKVPISLDSDSDEESKSGIAGAARLVHPSLQAMLDEDEEEEEEESNNAPPHSISLVSRPLSAKAVDEDESSSTDDEGIDLAAARLRRQFHLRGKGDRDEIERLMQVYLDES